MSNLRKTRLIGTANEDINSTSNALNVKASEPLNVTLDEPIDIATPSPIDVNIDGADTINGATRGILGFGDLISDAWGHQKVVQDVSLFGSSFTFNVDRNLWVPYENDIEIYYDVDVTKIGSVNGKLNISSGATIGDTAFLESRRHPRYQPNRGHLYSSSIFLPVKAAIGIREFGLFDEFGGVFFRLEDGVLYAVIRTTINTVTSEPFVQEIDLTAVGLSTLDLEKGNIYDIQMQWRGVGNIFWYIGDPLTANSKLVATYTNLNTNTELSTFNPALPVGYKCTNTNGTDVVLEGGCVDVTSEQGDKGKRSYSSTATDEINLSAQEYGVLCLRIPNLFQGTENTRDLIISRITSYCDDNALIRVYYFRDPTAITATFVPIRLGFQEQAIGVLPANFDTTKMIKIFQTRVSSNRPEEFTNPDKNNGDFVLAHGDYFFITMEAKNQSQGGVGLEWSEEIA